MKASLFIYIWLCWVFVSVRGLSLVAASGGHSSSLCAGLSLSRPLLLRSTSSRRASSVVVAHGPSCSTAFGIFPDQGSNPCPLLWQADCQPLSHQGSPLSLIKISHGGKRRGVNLWFRSWISSSRNRKNMTSGSTVFSFCSHFRFILPLFQIFSKLFLITLPAS